MSRRNRKQSKTTNIPTKPQSSKPHQRFNSHNWKWVAIIVLALAVAAGMFQSLSAMHPSNNTIVVEKDQAPNTAFIHWTNDIQVLAYSDAEGWQPMRLGQVARGQEFQFNGHLYSIDQNNGIWEVGVDVTKLAEANRGFEPYQWRYPKMEDVVRFVDQNNRHVRHDRMGTFKAGDRFLFQGILYEGFTDPNSPGGLAYRATNLVQNRDGNIVTVEEYALAAGDSLDEVYGYNTSKDDPSGAWVNATAGAGSTNLPVSTGNANVAGRFSQFSNGVSSSGLGGMPTDFGFTGQRWEQSIGLYDYGARFYDPALGRFISPDPIVPNPQNPQSWNRYSYVLNNPVKYTDPTGHMACLEDDFCFRQANGNDLVVRGGSYFINPVEIGLANYYLSGDTVHLNAVPDYNPLPLAYSKAGVEVGLGYRENRPGMPDIASGVGAAIVAGKWAEEGQAEILPAGSMPASVRRDSNAIGQWGEQQVGQHLPVEIRQIRMPGRTYDGRMPSTGQFVEIKTTTRGVVALNPHIRQQITFDATQESRPLWIFVNGRPTQGLQAALDKAGIPWQALNVP